MLASVYIETRLDQVGDSSSGLTSRHVHVGSCKCFGARGSGDVVYREPLSKQFCMCIEKHTPIHFPDVENPMKTSEERTMSRTRIVRLAGLLTARSLQVSSGLCTGGHENRLSPRRPKCALCKQGCKSQESPHRKGTHAPNSREFALHSASPATKHAPRQITPTLSATGIGLPLPPGAVAAEQQVCDRLYRSLDGADRVPDHISPLCFLN